MDAFAKNVKALIKDRDTTQTQFAKSIGVSITTVNGWIKRGVQPQAFNIDAICKEYGVSHDDLLSDGNGFYAKLHGLTNAPAGAIHVTPMPGRAVPVRTLGAVHAGDADEPWQLDGEAMLLEELAERHPNCFALQVNGTCMNRHFTDRDYVFVDPDEMPRDGSIAVVSIDGETVVRRLKRGNDSITLVAESADPGEWPDTIVKGEERDVRPVGTVFWWQSQEETG